MQTYAPCVCLLTTETLKEFKLKLLRQIWAFAAWKWDHFCCIYPADPTAAAVALLSGSQKKFLNVFSCLFFFSRCTVLDSRGMCRFSFTVGLPWRRGFDIKSNPVNSHRRKMFFFLSISPSKLGCTNNIRERHRLSVKKKSKELPREISKSMKVKRK